MSRVTVRLFDARGALRRFPVAVLIACTTAVVANLANADVLVFSDRTWSRIPAGALAAFLAAFAAHLWAQGRRWPYGLEASIAACAGLVAAGLIAFHDQLAVSMVALVGATALAGLCAGHLRANTTQDAYWLFTARLGLALLAGIVGALVICGGLSAIVASLDHLFGIDLGSNVSPLIWTTGVTLVGPLFVLGIVPESLDERFEGEARGGGLDRIVKRLCLFALAPVFLAYAVILHLYAAKIALEGRLPHGEIGWLVAIFAGIGIVSCLVGYPWRETGGPAMRWIFRLWHWALPVPVALLGLATWERIEAYGMTRDRYLLALGVVWLALVFLYLAIGRGRADIRAIPASLAVLLLAAAIGPWGAIDVSARSQVARLQALLAGEGVLVDGRLPEAAALSGQAEGEARGIIDELASLDELHRISPWFQGREPDPFVTGLQGRELGWEVRRTLGIASPLTGGRDYALFAKEPVQLDLDGYTVLAGPFKLEGYGIASAGSGTTAPAGSPIALVRDGTAFAIGEGAVSVRLDLAPTLRARLEEDPDGELRKPLVVGGEADGARAAVVFPEIGASIGSDQVALNWGTFWVLWRPPSGE